MVLSSMVVHLHVILSVIYHPTFQVVERQSLFYCVPFPSKWNFQVKGFCPDTNTVQHDSKPAMFLDALIWWTSLSSSCLLFVVLAKIYRCIRWSKWALAFHVYLDNRSTHSRLYVSGLIQFKKLLYHQKKRFGVDLCK